MKKVKSLLSFMLGVAVGSGVTLGLLKDYYERRCEEDIAEVKAMYKSRKSKEAPKQKEEPEETPHERGLPLKEYTDRLQKEGYRTNYNTIAEPESVRNAVASDPGAPVVIAPEEFGEIDDYEKLSLTYYADGFLTDSDDDEINDPEPLIGDALEHFGEFDSNTVLVRNDERQCYYEVLRDMRRYETDVYPNLPPRY